MTETGPPDPPAGLSASEALPPHQGAPLGEGDIRSVPYDRRFLEASWDWLQEPELLRLLDIARPTREVQRAWFDGLATREGYFVWGVEVRGIPAAIFGIKHLGADGSAEWFMFVGDRRNRGLGIGDWIERAIEEKARALGAHRVWGYVVEGNEPMLHLHRKHGYTIAPSGPGRLMVTKEI